MLRNLNKVLPSIFLKGRCKFSTLPKEEKIKVGDYYINHAIVGTGPHFVLCMPANFGSLSKHFKHQFEDLDREKFTLVAWDPPGFGKSRPPNRLFSSDMYKRDAELAHTLMKVLSIPKYSVMGWSGGGISSLILAGKHSDAVRKMIVWGARSFILAHELEVVKKVRDIKTWSKGLLNMSIEVHGLELTAQYGAGWVDAMFEIYKTRDGNICDDLLKDIKCPTLLLYGESDKLIDKSHPEHIHKNIKNSRLHTYQHAGHTMPAKMMNNLNKQIQEFLLEP